MIKFEKVSFEQWRKDINDNTFSELDLYDEGWEQTLREMYDDIQLPTRATSGSAGYDFKSPFGFTLAPGETIVVPTGIRVAMDYTWCMLCLPKSGLGFKYRSQLDNTIGLIDADYYYSDNEGHIMAKITNDSKKQKTMDIARGKGFMQGVFIQYGVVDDDTANGVRNGGFGSTG